ncbi:FAD-binding oxidoreductase [Phytoactinopolyspora alkaliphila]|uniref:FAD-binding oxidoreductase n=1 Tax=Phytoactinopolyspora alkaliphila TaxID=1783498 RepID=A0A6N9YRI1_9ACTN|nr:FAD-binding oxidoreductase [Phytoactinopolyspora alkaliphila]NED97438.1 FAD-binding oxidoreductase [Phytoactinopolyspora alkaliphila]
MHRTEADTGRHHPAPPRIAVIGAGAMGLAAAVRAAQLGHQVTVFERDHPAAGSSGLSAGIFNRQAVDPLDIAIRIEAERFLSELERDRGLDLRRDGYIRLARTEEQLARLAGALEVERSLGVPDAALLTPPELAGVVPGLHVEDLAGGLYGPSDGHLDGHQLCSVLAGLARDLGARIRTETVTGHRRARSGRHILTTMSADGAESHEEADVVVNAAGAWASQVGEMLEAPVPLVPQRHQVVQVQLPRPLDRTVPAVNEYVPGSGDYALYFRGEGPALLLAGLHTHDVLDGHASEDPDRFDRGVSDDYAIEVAQRLTLRLPGAGDLRFAGGWSGLYPISPDGLPQIGPHPDHPTVVLACGGGGVGLTNGLVYGRIAAEWAVLGEARSIPEARRYLPGRSSLTVVESR